MEVPVRELGGSELNIYEYSRCDLCGKEYKGMFYLRKDGKVSCVDCNEPVEFKRLDVQKTTEKDTEVLNNLVIDLMKRDLNRIYIPRVESGKEVTDFMRNEDGTIDSRVIYFQNNPIDLVTTAHTTAYTALKYMESGKEEFKEVANEIVEDYLRLREVKFTNEEVTQLWDKLFSDEINRIIEEVENE